MPHGDPRFISKDIDQHVSEMYNQNQNRYIREMARRSEVSCELKDSNLMLPMRFLGSFECMRIREANKEDRSIWDSFAAMQGGSFGYYFDCRHLSDNVHRLMVETDEHELIGICRFDKEERPLYSTLRINGFLFRRPTAQKERYHATREFLDYKEKPTSDRCSTFIVQESGLDFPGNDSNPALLDHGFRFRNYVKNGLPCSHILPLKAPFEETIWKVMWSQKLRKD